MVLPDEVLNMNFSEGTSSSHPEIVIEIDQEDPRPDADYIPVRSKPFHTRLQSIVHRNQFDLLPSVIDQVHHDLVIEAECKSEHIKLEEQIQELQAPTRESRFKVLKGARDFIVKEYKV
jgi:hypothetical protein